MAGIAAALMLALPCAACTDPYKSAKEAVRHSMKDPDSTQFRDIAWCGKEGGAVLGEYNSKNSYGAYAGFKQFYYADSTAVSDLDDYRYEEIYRRCMKEMARHTASISGSAYNEAAQDAQLNAIFLPDNFDITDSLINETGTLTPTKEEVPVCDRPDSAEKSALMNKIGVDCLGE